MNNFRKILIALIPFKTLVNRNLTAARKLTRISETKLQYFGIRYRLFFSCVPPIYSYTNSN